MPIILAKCNVEVGAICAEGDEPIASDPWEVDETLVVVGYVIAIGWTVDEGWKAATIEETAEFKDKDIVQVGVSRTAYICQTWRRSSYL